MNEKIKVSILMPTFNHEKYIRQAIESVLIQKVNFQYEILVGDDCSTDKTRSVLMKYYSQVESVRLFFRKKNLGATKNMYSMTRHMQGQYFIVLEGDDYWKDEGMLQKKVDFLDRHQEYVGVGGRIEVVNERGRYVQDILPLSYYGQKKDLQDFLRGEPLHFRAILWRNVIRGEEEKFKIVYRAHRILGDFTWNILCLEYGSVYMTEDIVSCYRCVERKGRSNYNSLRNWYERYWDHIYILNYLEKHHIYQHDYTAIYVIKTARVLKRIFETMQYQYLLKVLLLVGWQKMFIAILNYRKYKDAVE